jgi:hypothetical protein
MAGNQSRLKWKLEPFNLRWQPTDTLQTLLYSESRLLEMISTEAPLETILNELCSALDAQIGRVTSLMSLPEQDEESEPSVAPSASHLGFSTFYCTEIVSRSGDLLATFEMYCCIPRTPTSAEMTLIERAVRVATRAILRNDPEEELAGWSAEGEPRHFHKLTWSRN